MILRVFLFSTSLFLVSSESLDAEISLKLCTKNSNLLDQLIDSNLTHGFRIDPQFQNCSNGVYKTIELPLESDSIFDSETDFYRAENWTVFYENLEFSTDDYCIEGLTNSSLELQLCNAEHVDKKNDCPLGCIRKCCEPSEMFVLNDDGVKCTSSDNPWNPVVYKDKGSDEILSGNESTSAFHFISSHPREDWCEDPYVLSTREYENTTYLVRILQDGTVIVKNSPLNPWRELKQGDFCIDGIINSTNDLIVVDCSGPTEEIETNLTIYVVFQAIACIFLLATVIVYTALWERQNIHSWTLLGYVNCALCLYTCLFVNYIYNHNRTYFSNFVDVFCTSLAVVTHFLYLSMFCWLTLINFDVWCTFKYLRMTVGGPKRKRRFFLYFLFTLVAPAVVISIGLSLDHFYKDDLISSVVYPDYGGRNCYINFQTSSAFFYMLLPAAILMGCNLIFFFLTIHTLYTIGETTKFATNKSSQADSAKPRFLLFIKLFFVMGLCWILEVVTYFPFGSVSTNPFAIVLDIISILQPIAIFIIFVCKADVLRGLQVKFPFVRPIFQHFGLQQLPNRSGSGGSSASVATQVSTCSSISSTRSIRSAGSQNISLETMARLNKI